MSKQLSPVIGITTYNRDEIGDFKLPGAYIDAVIGAGGIPVLIPSCPSQSDRLLHKLDGLILAGGGDIDPAHYNADLHPTIYMVSEERDRFELDLAHHALQHEVPTLGICRGMQILNVATGGDLIPHVPEVYGEAIAHRVHEPRSPIPHPVRIDSNSRLSRIVGDVDIEVMSWHHQAVRAIAPVWDAVAHAEDGLVEAMEHRDHPWMIAVQWHPELAPNNIAHQRLFKALVDAASV